MIYSAKETNRRIGLIHLDILDPTCAMTPCGPAFLASRLAALAAPAAERLAGAAEGAGEGRRGLRGALSAAVAPGTAGARQRFHGQHQQQQQRVGDLGVRLMACSSVPTTTVASKRGRRVES